MSETNREQERYKRARALIKIGEYDAARAILQDLDHKDARKLLDELNARFPPPAGAPARQPEKPKGRPRLSPLVLLLSAAVVVLVGALLVVLLPRGGGGTDGQPVLAAATATPGDEAAAPAPTTTPSPQATATPTITPTPAPQRLLYTRDNTEDIPADGGAQASEGRLIPDVPLVPGVYRMRLTTDDALNVSLYAEEEACSDVTPLMSVEQDEAVNGLERLFSVGDCQFELLVRDVGQPWEIELVPLVLEEAQPIAEAYTSDPARPRPVLGPLRIPAGEYQVSVETEGDFALDVTVLDGRCTETVGFLNARDGGGRTSETLESEGCTAVLHVIEATGPWTLSVQEAG